MNDPIRSRAGKNKLGELWMYIRDEVRAGIGAEKDGHAQ